MAGLALEHEISKQFDLLESLSRRLQSPDRDPEKFAELGKEIEQWIERARGSQRLFSHLVNAEDREARDRMEVILLASDVTEQTRLLLRGTDVDLSSVDRDFLLPEGRVAEWTAIFQNAYFNAYDAMLDQARKSLWVKTAVNGKRRSVFIEDTGVGVDLSNAEELFEPFVRRLDVSRDRRRLQIGSSGLGLTIIRMIATALGCSTHFIEPEPGFSTCLEIAWDER
jgi:signal transduction histidine kinase